MSSSKKICDSRPVSTASVMLTGKRTSARAIMGAIHSVQISAYMEVQRRHLMRAITYSNIHKGIGNVDNSYGSNASGLSLSFSRLSYLLDVCEECELAVSKQSQLLDPMYSADSTLSTSHYLAKVPRKYSRKSINEDHISALQQYHTTINERNQRRSSAVVVEEDDDEAYCDEKLCKDGGNVPEGREHANIGKQNHLNAKRMTSSEAQLRVPAPAISLFELAMSLQKGKSPIKSIKVFFRDVLTKL